MASKSTNIDIAKVNDSGKSMKTFRSSTELEDLIRYVHENGLRREAHVAIDFVTKSLKPKRKTRTRKTKKTLQ